MQIFHRGLPPHIYGPLELDAVVNLEGLPPTQ
jgi:uncharacterized protein (DUF952 family)